jgi:YbbR domain-containing protein
MSFRSELRELLTDNIGYKLISLVFSVTLWIWVQSDMVVSEHFKVRLDWQLPEGMVATENLLASTTVVLEGVQAVVRTSTQRELTISVDLSKAKPGDVTVDLSDKIIRGLPDQVRVVSLSPSSLRVQLDRILRKKVDVTPSSVGELASGFVLKGLTVKPQEIELLGPSSLLRNVTRINTDPIDLSGVREDETLQVGLDIKDGIRTTGEQSVSVGVDVEEVRKSRRLEGVHVVLQDDGRFALGVAMVSVVVGGRDAVLAGLKPEDVEVQVVVPPDYDGRAGEVPVGTEGLHYTVKVPEEVEVEKVEPERLPLVAKEGG